jgi:LEA14-like dessication related protein
MKKLILLLTVGFLLLACKVTEKPEFIGVNSLKIKKVSTKEFTVLANLQFQNKNDVGGTLQAKEIHVFIDSIDVATVATEVFNVPKKEAFELPLQVQIPFDKIYKNNKQNLLENIMNIISNKKVNIFYKGVIRYEKGVFHYNYPLDYQQEISLKK